MRLLADLTPFDPMLGLAIEEVLLESVRASRVETIRLWRNRRAVVLGRSQSLAAEVDEARASKLDIPILRRISGGGTVYQYPGNLNVSVFMHKRAEFSEVASIFAFFGRLLSDALAALSVGLHAQDNGLYVGDKKKVGGAAQAHRGAAMLYHTTLLVQPSIVPMETLLSAMRPGYCPGGIASRPRLTTTLFEQVARLIESHELVTPIVDALACALGEELALGDLTPQETQRANELVATKYGRAEWNAKL